MSSSIANSEPCRLGLAVGLLIAATFVLHPLAQRVERSAVPAGWRAEQLLPLAGHGGVWAIVGGMRSVVASNFWLRANLAWERHDPAGTEELIALTVAADERPLYFWLNGARMIAYDLPEWRVTGSVPEAVRQKVREEYAGRALRLLEQGLRWHGADAGLYIEMGNLHLKCTGDKSQAAHFYRLAAQEPGAPYYAARIHGELLRALGRHQEALTWLRQILPQLPATDPAACRPVVLARIAALEAQLAGP